MNYTVDFNLFYLFTNVCEFCEHFPFSVNMVIDFTQPSTLRQFELIIEGKQLFINQHFLAELSPYFLALCFTPEFREAREGRVEITDISFDDMQELLQHICPDDDFIMQSTISGNRFPRKLKPFILQI